jgi:hypothetical protein
MKSRTRSTGSCDTAEPLTRSRKRNTNNDEAITHSVTRHVPKLTPTKDGQTEEEQSTLVSNNVAIYDVTAPNENEDFDQTKIDSRRRSQQQRRKVQFDALHQEMELVSYSVSESGQARRVIPRHLSIERTKKRRLLEKQDRRNNVTIDDHDTSIEPIHRRIRGPKAAAEDHIVQASLVFEAKSAVNDNCDNDDGNENDGDDVEDDDEGSIFEDAETIDIDTMDVLNEEIDDDSEENMMDDDEEEEIEELQEIELPELTTNVAKRSKPKRSSAVKFPSLKRKKTTQLQRLKNFKSTRMAEKHGAALGAHVQGKPALAIRKLKQIAASAPLAPQIYSSLGMVYEDLLQESQRKSALVVNKEPENKSTSKIVRGDACRIETVPTIGDPKVGSIVAPEEQDTNGTRVQEKLLRQQLNLAKKAYGSYHAAAILYKRDYSLWLRAADSAYEICNIHTTIIKLPDITNDIIQYHRAEKKLWLEEARKDYQAADNLNPPGIEIPAKLALVMIELGMLSEAITLLTCLKNHVEFDRSYRAWLLFADLMLRIGYECNRWNAGTLTCENKMFRRWLRKWSTTFDWKERRMQALVKSLEAASGSHCCSELIQWIRNRVDHANEKSGSTKDDDDSYPVQSSSTNENERNPPDIPDNQPDASNSIDEDTGRTLPPVASCNTVFSISTELMRHMLDMQLYYGGKLVGDSVSSYLKERQAICDARRKKKVEFEHSQQQPISLFAMQLESYDVGDDCDGNNSDNDAPISDDEGWDNATIASSLRKGTLPPELRFLYGLCLACGGGNTSLAAACISSVRLLSLESILFFKEPVIDCGVVQDIAWLIFHETKTQPYGRIVALSYAIDILRGCEREAEISVHLKSLFCQQAGTLYDEGWVDLVLNQESNPCVVSRHRRNYLTNLLLAASRYELHQLESTNDMNAKCDFISSRLTASITALSKLISVTWKVNPDGSIETTGVDAIDSLSHLLRTYCDHVRDIGGVQDIKQRETIINQLFKIASIICGNDALEAIDSIDRQTVDLTEIPIKSWWLSHDLESLSTTAFNLCVAINVSKFSGWLSEKFTAKSRSVGGANNFFGITTDEGPISGCLPECIEEEIAKQWDLLQLLFPNKITFNFRQKLQILKNSYRYHENRSNYVSIEGERRVFKYGEDRGLLVFLHFAHICLICDGKYADSSKLRFTALSILFPVTQFLLKETLWDANIGINVIAESSDIHEWLDVPQITDGENMVPPSHRPGYIRPSKRQLPVPCSIHGDKSLHEWFTWEDAQHPISNLLILSHPTLLRMWRECPAPIDSEGTSSANEIMHDVHDCMTKLRLCYTVQAAERLSILVAANLLKLVVHRDCLNPFTVIQLAAMFASQGPKGGTSDHLFRAKLLRSEDCTANDALLTLGRAECLNSLHFCPEAAFLCNHVANVCRLHCIGSRLIHSSNKRWLALSILSYNLSVIIRITTFTLLRNSDKRELASGVWADTVIDWFHHIRKMDHLKENLPVNVLNVASASFAATSLALVSESNGCGETSHTWSDKPVTSDDYDVDGETEPSVIVEV